MTFPSVDWSDMGSLTVNVGVPGPTLFVKKSNSEQFREYFDRIAGRVEAPELATFLGLPLLVVSDANPMPEGTLFGLVDSNNHITYYGNFPEEESPDGS